MVLVSTGCVVFMVYRGWTSCFRTSSGLFLSLRPETGRTDWSGVRVIRCRVWSVNHTAVSHGGALDFGVWPRK